MKCSDCDKEATFVSPRQMCDSCWARWWVNYVYDGFPDEVKEKEIKKIVDEDM